jgi:hypothetical protein
VTSTYRSPPVPQQAPYLLTSPGALTAFTIDLISRPAAAAAAAAIAEESRRCLWSMAASQGRRCARSLPGDLIGSTAATSTRSSSANLCGRDGLAAAHRSIHGRFTDEQRKGVFGPEIPVGDDATP